MKVRYDLLFKNGVKEKVIQEAPEEKHAEIVQLIVDTFQNNSTAVITFGNGEIIGRHVKVSDLSQVQTEILEKE